MTKFFFICRYAYVPGVYTPLLNWLNSLAHDVTYAWAKNDKHDIEWTKHLANDVKGLSAADAVICFWPGGHDTMTEFGVALGLGKPIHVVVGQHPNHPLPSYFRYPTNVTLHDAWPIQEDHDIMQCVLEHSMYLKGKEIISEIIGVPMVYETLDKNGETIENNL